MKVLDAVTLPDGSRHFVIEVTPAVGDKTALIEEFTWGADVPLATARRETKMLLDVKYGGAKPAKIASMIDKDV